MYIISLKNFFRSPPIRIARFIELLWSGPNAITISGVYYHRNLLHRSTSCDRTVWNQLKLVRKKTLKTIAFKNQDPSPFKLYSGF